VAFIKVKRVATNLSTRHLRQVETYAVNEGVEYIIVTNGSVWRQTGHRARYGRDCDEDIRSDEVAGFHSHALLMRCSRHPVLPVAVRPTIAS
jgi:hypothetical protein